MSYNQFKMTKFKKFYKDKSKRSTNALLKEHKKNLYMQSNYYKEIQRNEYTGPKDSSHGCLCYCGVCMG